MPEEVRTAFGGALRMAQLGERPEDARPFGEGLPRQIMKMVKRLDGDTYRMAFTWALPGAVYLLDVFKKRSSSGRATPKRDLNRILRRWKDAQIHNEEFYRE